jgi:acetyl esterase/lipase
VRCSISRSGSYTKQLARKQVEEVEMFNRKDVKTTRFRIHSYLGAVYVAAATIFISYVALGQSLNSVAAKTYVFKTVDGHEIKADVRRATSQGEPKPVLVWIHGGALIFGTREHNPPQLLASKVLDAGFIIVSIDYRLAPETKLPDIIEDVKDAVVWVRRKGPKLFGADPERVCVAGDSAGGYLTLMSGLVVHPKPKALASFYGYGDIVGDWYSKPDPHYAGMEPISKQEVYGFVNEGVLSQSIDMNRFAFYLYLRQHGLWPKEVGGWDPQTDYDAFIPYCPDRNVTVAYPPTILLHGTKDKDVPHALSERMAKALENAGVEHEFVSLPNVEHGFVEDDAERNIRALDRAVAFLAKHISSEDQGSDSK